MMSDTNIRTLYIHKDTIDDTKEEQPYHDVWKFAGRTYDELIIDDADSLSEWDLRYLMCRLRSTVEGLPRVVIEGYEYTEHFLTTLYRHKRYHRCDTVERVIAGLKEDKENGYYCKVSEYAIKNLKLMRLLYDYSKFN